MSGMLGHSPGCWTAIDINILKEEQIYVKIGNIVKILQLKFGHFESKFLCS